MTEYVQGARELRKKFKRLGKVPQKHVTYAAKKGMKIVYKEAKNNAPVDTGELKEGIKMVGEKSRKKAKKVYRLVFDRAKNDIFQKKDKSGNVIAYYPVSQEYGYFLKNGKYMPGLRFMRGALEKNAKEVEKTIINEMNKRIDKELKK